MAALEVLTHSVAGMFNSFVSFRAVKSKNAEGEPAEFSCSSLHARLDHRARTPRSLLIEDFNIMP